MQWYGFIAIQVDEFTTAFSVSVWEVLVFGLK